MESGRLGRIWFQFLDAIAFFLPILLIAAVVSVGVYVFFVVFFPGVKGAATEEPEATPGNQDKKPPAYFGWPSYIAMTAITGSVLGVLLSIVGGFGGTKAGEDTLPGTVLSVVVVVLAATSTLFGAGGKIALRRPLGAIAFLICFVLCGLYWKFIRAEFGDLAITPPD